MLPDRIRYMDYGQIWSRGVEWGPRQEEGLSWWLDKDEFDRMYQDRIQNLPTQGTQKYMDHEEDYEGSYAMALKATETFFVHKGLEIAVIANPDNGSDFFCVCISFTHWGERGCKMTPFRVSDLARAHITSQEKCRLFEILASDDAGDERTHHKRVREKGRSSSAIINRPKDVHSPSTTKGRPLTSRKHPRPAASESSESLEEQFEVLGREDAEDSRDTDSEQQSNSQQFSPSRGSRSRGSRQSSLTQGSRSRGSQATSSHATLPSEHRQASSDHRDRMSDTGGLHPSAHMLLGADMDDSGSTQIRPLHLAVLSDINNIRRAICDRRAPQEGLQDICRLLGSLSYTGQMDPNARLGEVWLKWADLPTHCKVGAGFDGVSLWNVFTGGIIGSVFTMVAEFLLDDGALVVACRAEHLFKVTNEVYEF
ncbi:hypothetical protein L7F22_018147 [Adiantum nelumboides]|nr:hypothetical protein [Adiantum nelumboides]